MARFVRLASALLTATATAAVAQPPADAPYLDPDLPAGKRAADIVARITLEERILQMQSTAPAIPRLGVPAYNWWNEALHGVVQGRASTRVVSGAAVCPPSPQGRQARSTSGAGRPRRAGDG
jgi:beta-glucosidase